MTSAGKLRIGGSNNAFLNKRKKIKKRKLQTNKFVVDRRPRQNTGEAMSKNNSSKTEKSCKSKRAPYFHHFRNERTALKILENTFTRVDNRKTYRANRYLYYFVIPHLAKYLWFEPDRARLVNVEHDFYNELLSYTFRRKRNKEPNRVNIWSFRNPTIEDGLSAKL